MKLAIFKVNQLGDNVVFLPVVQALRARFPAWPLFLLTSPVAAELFTGDLPPAQMLIMPTPVFNGAWKRPPELLRLTRRLRRERCDASLIANDQGNVAHFLSLAAGGKVRVGLRPPFIKVPGGLTEIVQLPEDLPAARINWELARVLVQRLTGEPWPELPPPPELRHFTGDAQPIPRRIVIHPGASQAYKRWFPDRFQALARRLAGDFEVIWIEQEETRALALPPTVARVAPGSIRALTHLLRTAHLFIGNNSGPMNLAFALGCPSLILTGPSPLIWDPFWFPERMQMLRATSVPCVPCDGVARPALVCRNTAEPMACMAFWSVDEVHRRSVEWIERWRDFPAETRRAPEVAP